MKIIFFIKKFFILHLFIFILKKYIKKSNYDFSLFIYTLKINSSQNTDNTNGELNKNDWKDNNEYKYIKLNSSFNVTDNNQNVNERKAKKSDLNDPTDNYLKKFVFSNDDNLSDDEHSTKKYDNENNVEKKTLIDEKIPIIYTSIDDIKRFPEIRGKLKIIYVKSFYDQYLKELYEAKFQFYHNNVIYVTTFAVVRNAIEENFNQTDRWLVADMKVLQKNNYNISITCNDKIKSFHGTISFTKEELENFEILRKSLKNKVNITYDKSFYNLNTFYSSKRKYLDYINFKYKKSDIKKTFDTEGDYAYLKNRKYRYKSLKHLSNDKIKFATFSRIHSNYKTICDLKEGKKIEDRFIIYNLLKDNVIELEEDEDTIIFETSENKIFTYDPKYSKEIKILSNNFEIELLMDENAFLNSHNEYFYLNKHNPIHLELQDKGIFSFKFIYSWLFKYFVNNKEHINYYPHFYMMKNSDNSEIGLDKVKFYTLENYSFIEKGQKITNIFTHKNENDSLRNISNIIENKSELMRKKNMKYDQKNSLFTIENHYENLGIFDNKYDKIKKGESAKYINNSTATSFTQLNAKLNNEKTEDNNNESNKGGDDEYYDAVEYLDNNNPNENNSSNTNKRHVENDDNENDEYFDSFEDLDNDNNSQNNGDNDNNSQNNGGNDNNYENNDGNDNNSQNNGGNDNNYENNDGNDNNYENNDGNDNNYENNDGNDNNSQNNGDNDNNYENNDGNDNNSQNNGDNDNNYENNGGNDDNSQSISGNSENTDGDDNNSENSEDNDASKTNDETSYIGNFQGYLKNIMNRFFYGEDNEENSKNENVEKTVVNNNNTESSENVTSVDKDSNNDNNTSKDANVSSHQQFLDNQQPLPDQQSSPHQPSTSHQYASSVENSESEQQSTFDEQSEPDEQPTSGNYSSPSNERHFQFGSSATNMDKSAHSTFMSPKYHSDLGAYDSHSNNNNIHENLRDKFNENDLYLYTYNDILAENSDRVIVGIAQKEMKDQFILNWLNGNDIICVLRPEHYKQLFHDDVKSNYLTVLNSFKFRNDMNGPPIDKDSKSLTVNADFYPHYSKIKLFFYDESDIFQKELKSYLLLIYYLLNSNNSPCKDYKNIRYFYSQDTFNISHLNFISNKLLFLASECALKILKWNIPKGIIKSNENYINASIFNKALKYVNKKIFHYGFKLNILELVDAVQFSIKNYKTLENNYQAKYDIFLKLISELFSLQSLGLLHANIKADNYFIQKKNNKNKYLDILLGNFSDIIEEGSYEKVKGSPIYLAPEKLDSFFYAIVHNLKSDIFSLGLSLSTVFLKKSFFLRNIESKLKFPSEKYTISLIRRNPMILLWIKSANPFIKKRFDIFKFRSYLKVTIHSMKQKLSKKYLYNWFTKRNKYIDYIKENDFKKLYNSIKNKRQISNKNSLNNKDTQEDNSDICSFFSNENELVPNESTTSRSPVTDDSNTNNNEFFSNNYSETVDHNSKSSNEKTQVPKRKNFLQLLRSRFSKFSNNFKKGLKKHKKMEKPNLNEMPSDNKFEKEIITSTNENDDEKYANACKALKNGIIGTCTKIFSIEYEKFRPDIYDMYFLVKKELKFLKKEDDKISDALFILRSFPEPDISSILKEKINQESYEIKKMIILKALIFYGYFEVYERLSYEFKLYESENFPLYEKNEDTFEKIVINSMDRQDYNELSNILLIQHIYNHYQTTKAFSNLVINLYTVNKESFYLETSKITKLLRKRIRKILRKIDYTKMQNFVFYMKSRSSIKKIISNKDNYEFNTTPKMNYDSIYVASNKNEMAILSSFIVKIDNFVANDLKVNLAVILNHIFWNLKNKCKCINYTHMQVDYKNKEMTDYAIKDAKVDIHKPIGNILKELESRKHSNSTNENKVVNLNNNSNLVNIHLDVVLRNSLFVNERKTFLNCGKKFSKKEIVYTPTISSERKDETVKIKIGLGTSHFFYLSFHLSMIKSQEIFLKDIIYFIYQNYKSEIKKSFYTNIKGKKTLPFKCISMNEHNTFFYNNVTNNFIKETSFNKVLSALYHINLTDPSYVIKSSLNYYNNRKKNSVLLRLVTVSNVLYEKKDANSKQTEYFLESSNNANEEFNKNKSSLGFRISKEDAQKIKKSKNKISMVNKDVGFYYMSADCLNFLNKKVISFYNNNNTTNIFEQIIIPSKFLYVETKKKLFKNEKIHTTKSINFNIVSNIMNLQKYQNEIYTTADFVKLILKWKELNEPYDKNYKCNFLTCKNNMLNYDMILSYTTSKEVKLVLYNNNENFLEFLFSHILKGHKVNKYTPQFLMSYIHLYNLKIYFAFKNEIKDIFPNLENSSTNMKKEENLKFAKCLKSLEGKNVTLLGQEINEELYVPLRVKIFNRNLIYRISKQNFKKLIFKFKFFEVPNDEKQLHSNILSSLREIELKFKYLFLKDLSYYVNISNITRSKKLFFVDMNKNIYKYLKENDIYKNNYTVIVEKLINYMDNNPMEHFFVIKNKMNYFMKRKILNALRRIMFSLTN